MKYLESYLQTIRERGNSALADSIEKTALDIKSELKNFTFSSNEIGLLFGNVQSGKTGQMFGIISEATDLGFPIFILLTTDNVALQMQTLERVKTDLNGYLVCGENDSKLFADNNLIDPVIIVLKKNARVLRQWANVLKSTGFVKGNPLFIIDDEADAASLNTMVNQDKQSSINRYLTEIRNESLSSIFLQVTGTPQALLLQTVRSEWKPQFTYYFKPGETYLGGEFFFPSGEKPKHITFLNTRDDSLEDLILRHLVISAQLLLSGKNVSNCLLHPGVRVASHKKVISALKKSIVQLNNDSKLSEKIAQVYKSISPVRTKKLPLNEIDGFVKDVLKHNQFKILEMNSNNEVESSLYSEGINFIVGGNTLGRGVTFPSLNTIYYTRTAKKPQADTMWQHSRMFGYDRDPGLMMVYLDENLYKIFSDINGTNNSIISQIENGIDDVKIFYPKDISPTRKNVLDQDAVFTVAGGTNYYPFNPDNKSIEKIDKLLSGFDEKKEFHQVSLRLIRELLNEIEPSPEFSLFSFDSVLETLLSEKPSAQGILVVRRNRHVTHGTGALLSADDFQLSNSFKDKAVLTMYEIKGDHGWKQDRLWVPNIKLPNNALYYDLIEN